MNFDGILLVDKPQSITSSKVVVQLKKKFNINKIGHSGTLDPLATGLLVLGIGEGTKLLDNLLNADKAYHTTALLGKTTDTYDIEGNTLTNIQNHELYNDKIIQGLTQAYSGKQLQTPPVYSAIKHKGKPLYRYARQGTIIQPKSREITIHKLDITQPSINLLEISVHCSKGTYIRSLVHDIGERLGVGACIQVLRRHKIAHFNLQDAYSLDELLTMSDKTFTSKLLPIESTLPKINSHVLTKPEAKKLFFGQNLSLSNEHYGQLLLYYNKLLVATANNTPTQLYITKRISMKALSNEIE
jgi:tRNA pseudouridine55 synthase